MSGRRGQLGSEERKVMKIAALPIVIGSVFVCVCAVPGASPEMQPLHQLTLEQAWALAERHHPSLEEARAFVEAAEGRARQAGAFPNPEAVARLEAAPLNSRATRDAEYLGGISQAVPLGRRLSKAREAELLEREQLVRQTELKRRDLQRRVHSAFATALYQEQALLLQKEIVSHAEQSVATLNARLEAGDALPEDLARVEMEWARAQVERRRAGSMRDQALAVLVSEIGEPRLPVQSLEGSLESAFEIPALEALTIGLDAHPFAAAASAEIRASEARMDLAKVERIPDIRVELLYRRLEREKQNAFDLGFSIPLPLFDRNQGRLRETRAELAAAEARSRSTRNELMLRARQSHAQLTASLAGSRTFKEEILPRAETILESAEARYAQGDLSLAELLPVRRDWAAVQLDYLESLRDVMQSWAEVRALSRRE
jgi:outer membrane protein, heavy metal efflux system